jgi:hypothetical protein
LSPINCQKTCDALLSFHCKLTSNSNTQVSPYKPLVDINIANEVVKVYFFNHSINKETLRISTMFKTNDSINLPSGLSLLCLVKDTILRRTCLSHTMGTSIHSDNAKQILTILQGNDNRGCCLYISLTLQNMVPSLVNLSMQTIRLNSRLQKHGGYISQFGGILPTTIATQISVEYQPICFNSITTYRNDKQFECLCLQIQACCQYVRENPRCCLGRPFNLQCKQLEMSLCIRELRF